jgi:hypothetical protein
MDSVVLGKLSGGKCYDLPPQPEDALYHGSLEAVRSLFEQANDVRTQSYNIPIGSGEKLIVRAYPQFGLYLYQNDRFQLSFRCYSGLDEQAPNGHSHDDNLSVTLRTEHRNILMDPGTYLYTASANHRNQYRSADLHNGPRIQGRPITQTNEAHLFEMTHLAFADCILFSECAVAGVIEHNGNQILRLVEVNSDEAVITDAVIGDGKLVPFKEVREAAYGYGRK